MKIHISQLSYNKIEIPEPNEDGTVGDPVLTPVTDTESREFDIPDSVVQELNLTDTSYQEIGQYLVENLPKVIGGHPISGMAWEVVKNIVPFVNPNAPIDIETEVIPVTAAPIEPDPKS